MTAPASRRTPLPVLRDLTTTALVVVVAALAVATVPVVGLGRSWGPLTRDSVPVAAAGFSCLAATYAAARCRGLLRRCWTLLALMIVLNTVGASQWLAAGGSSTQRSWSGSDVLYLAALVPAVVVLVSYPVTRGWRGTWRSIVVDTLVVGSSLLLVGAVVALSEVHQRVHGARAVLFFVYPVSDVVVVTLIVVLLLRSTGQWRADVVLLGLTFVGFGVGDLAFAADGAAGREVGTVAQLGYTAAALLLSLAAVAVVSSGTGRRTLQRDVSGPVAAVLPDVLALVALAVCLVHEADDDLQLVTSVAVLVLTTLRRLTLAVQNRRLRRELEQRVCARTAELEQLTAEHERLDAMKQEFVSAVSHELRTPLTAIRGSLELLSDGDAGELPAAAVPVVEMAVRGSHRLSRLVDDIIDLERLQSGAFGVTPQPHDLELLVRDAVAPLVALGTESGVEVEVAPFDVPRVRCDGDRLTQALVNLVGNAVKFTPPGGRVTVGATREGEQARLWVADTGRGIPSEDLEAVFDRFHQVDPDDARAGSGAGLGLPITRHIVEAHGGRIWAESRLGVGSTFHLTLPLAEPAPPEEVPAPSTDPCDERAVGGPGRTTGRRSQASVVDVSMAAGS